MRAIKFFSNKNSGSNRPAVDPVETPKKTVGKKIKSAFTMAIPGRRKRKATEPITPSFRVLRTRPTYVPPTPTAPVKPMVIPITPITSTYIAPITVTPAPLLTAAGSSALSASTSSSGFVKHTAFEAQKLKTLEDASKNLPRYLFRACSPTSGGGLKGLNTIYGVFPHAFVDNNGKRLPNGGHKSIHDIDFQTVHRMANGHLTGQRPARTDPIYSEFSSWAASLALVLQYGHGRATYGGLICVLDRYNLPKNTKVYHCVDLQKAGLCDSPYDHEYLVHGPVEGPGFKAVTVQRLVDLGMYNHIPCVMPHSKRYWWGPCQQRDWESLFTPNEFTAKEIKALRKCADEFGKSFALPVLAAFLTLDRRKFDKSGKFPARDIKMFADAVEDLYIPEEYGGENSIVQPDGIYVNGYPMVAQLALLLKQLVEYNYGRGVRARRRIEVEDLSAELRALGLPEKKNSMDGVADKPGRLSMSFAFGVSDVIMAAA